MIILSENELKSLFMFVFVEFSSIDINVENFWRVFHSIYCSFYWCQLTDSLTFGREQSKQRIVTQHKITSKRPAFKAFHEEQAVKKAENVCQTVAGGGNSHWDLEGSFMAQAFHSRSSADIVQRIIN